MLEQSAEVRSQRLHAPFLDNQVVRACRELPEALRVRPGARAEILRTVLKSTGITDLPPGWGTLARVLGRRRAGGPAAVRRPLLDLFSRPLLADAGLVDGA